MSIDAEFSVSLSNEGYVMFKDEAKKETDKKINQNTFKYTNGFSHVLPPVDKYNLIYFGLILAGVGFLLPYNSFIMAVDYFKARYPGTTIMFDMSTIYIIMAFFSVLLNNLLVEALSLNTRITFGYIVSFVTLLFVAICEVGWDLFGVTTSYTINLIAIAVVAIGCTVQQSSFYGYTSMLPSRYTQAVMAGESAAGFWVSANRIFTKTLLEDEKGNTLVFFFISVLIVGLCFCIHQIIRKTDFVQYYIILCQESKTKIILEPTEDSGLMDQLDTTDEAKAQYGFLKLQTSPLGNETAVKSGCTPGTQYSAFSFENPVYEPHTKNISDSSRGGSSVGTFLGETDKDNPENGTNENTNDGMSGIKYKVEDIVIKMRPNTAAAPHVYHGSVSKIWSGVKRGWWARWEVSKLIWEDMLSIGSAYFLTLCLYPGVMSEITSCRYKSWLPVILMTLFNGFDLLGKVYSGKAIHWARLLLIFNCLRIMTVVMSLLIIIIINAIPDGELEYCAMVLAIFLGITNGVFGSVPMIVAPSKVPEQHREITGNIMTLSYNLGLTVGSIAAYFINDCIKLGDTKKCQNLTTTTSVPFLSNITTVASATSCCLLKNGTNESIPTDVMSVTESVVTAVVNIVSNNILSLNESSILTTSTMPLGILNVSTTLGLNTSNYIEE